MPEPNRRDRLSSDDFAKQIAERLAESGEAQTGVGFSLRNSVLVGRLMSGLIIVALAGGLAFAVTIGVNWFMGRSSAASVEAAPIYPEGDDGGDAPVAPVDTTPRDDFAGFGLAPSTTTTLAGPFAPTTTPAFSPRVTLPPTTTTTTSPVTTSAPTTTSTSSPGTTQPPPTTSSTAPPTTTSTTLPSTTTTAPTTTTTTAPTTTTTAPTTTTTASTTTTTTAPTTTTTAATTTTFGP